MVQQSRETPDEISKTKVTICSPTHIFNGYIHHNKQQRLLDAVNKGIIVTGQSRLSKNFVQITEVAIYSNDGRMLDKQAECFVGKGEILFIIEKQEDQQSATIDKPKPKMNLFRDKKAIHSTIEIGSYTIVGNMYTEAWLGLLHVLESDDSFLPITDAEIMPRPVTVDTSASFVAVNKAHITLVSEI